jgi:hypothetical protein
VGLGHRGVRHTAAAPWRRRKRPRNSQLGSPWRGRPVHARHVATLLPRLSRQCDSVPQMHHTTPAIATCPSFMHCISSLL